METKDIQKLIDFISQSGLDEVNIETSELKLAIKRYSNAAPVAVQAQPAYVAPAPVVAAPAPVAATSQLLPPLLHQPPKQVT